MAYNARELSVLVDFQIVNPDGSPRLVKAGRDSDDDVEALVPMMDEDTIARLIRCDTTPDQSWLSWIFMQAGGGKFAEQASSAAFESFKVRWASMYKHGATTKTGKKIPKLSDVEIHNLWRKVEPEFERKFEVLPESNLRMQTLETCFGYYRSWPGRGNVYAAIESAIRDFTALAENVDEYNSTQEFRTLSRSVTGYASLSSLQNATKLLKRFVESRNTELRGADNQDNTPLYDDDAVTVLAPQNYGTLVKYGRPSWQQSDPETYARYLNEPDYQSPVENGTRHYIIRFKVPVPKWMSGSRVVDASELLALVSRAGKLTVITAASGERISTDELLTRIKNEPVRELGNEDSDWKVGRPVYSNSAEADHVADSFSKALSAISSDAERIS